MAAALPVAVQAQESGTVEPAEEQSGPVVTVSDTPPPGFENIDTAIETMFDVIFADRSIGSTPVRLSGNQVQFLDPEGLARLFPDRVMRDRLIELLSQPLPSNEEMRCLPGRTGGCGALPYGEVGVIANPERFSLSVFLTDDYFSELDTGPVYLGDPISGPSLIQTAQLSLSTDRGNIDEVRFGAVLDTLASVGRTSLVAQTFVRDNGANLQRAYAQRFWNDRYAAGGLLQDTESQTFTSYRLLGAEFGSFFGTRVNESEGAAIPIEIVLPRAARVEIYRDDVLIQTLNLEAGLQRIDTRSFPTGSYPVRIVARDGNAVVLEETRVFTRVSGLPPAGETAFHLRAGIRALDGGFRSFSNGQSSDRPFLPELTDELIASAGVSRRIGDASALSGQVLLVDDRVFGEASFTTYQNNVTGLVAAAVGSEGSYSVVATGSLSLRKIDFYISGRHTRVEGPQQNFAFAEEFQPFLRSEDLVSGSMAFGLGPGTLSLTGSYSRTTGQSDRYSVGARYNFTQEIGGLGTARISAFGLKTDRDVRVGLTLSFFRRLSPNIMLSYSGGAEYREADEASDRPDGVFPVADARVSHNTTLGSADLVAQAGVSTDSDRHRAFAAADIRSNLGFADLQVEYEDQRGGGRSGVSLSANGFTGFTLGDGGFNFGTREIGGESAVTLEIDRSGIPEALRDDFVDDGQYSVILGNREIATFAPDETATIVLPPFANHSIMIQPEQAPPYIVDLTRRIVPLYPGNVVNLRYAAQLSVTVFGQLVDDRRRPLGGSRISAGQDTTVTDEQGYFLLTAPLDSEIQPFAPGGRACSPLNLAEVFADKTDNAQDGYLRLGEVLCALDAQAVVVPD